MPIPSTLTYILSISDVFLTPLYIILLFLIVKKLKKKYYSESPIRAFIMPAFFIHILGGIFFALIMQYYYGYGDTYGYYTGVREIWNAFLKSPKVAFELLFENRDNFSQTALNLAPYTSYTGFATATSAVVRIAGFVGLFCFGSYLPITLVLATFSLWGAWLIYVTINRYFPHLYKYTAIACLFIPSVVIWSSVLGKESPCMFALGLCFYSLDKILHRKAIFRHIIYVILGAIVLLAIKNYIFYTFAIAGFAWIFRSFITGIKSLIIRIVIWLMILIFVFSVLIYFLDPLEQTFMDGLSQGETFHDVMTSINDVSGGSGYTLPSFNLSVLGFIQSFFLSLNVALFRPYLWECTNPLMLMSFMESFATFLLVVFVIFKAGIRKAIRYCNNYSILAFMLVFSLVLAAVAGFISFNFGTLVRYKMPGLPFFLSFLVIILLDKPIAALEEKRLP